MKKNRKKKSKILIVLVLILGMFISIVGINYYVVVEGRQNIVATAKGKTSINYSELEDLRNRDLECIMVLGAAVKPNGRPSSMLKDRLDVGIYLYKNNVAPKLLLTGDNGQAEYNEVKAMYKYARELGVPKEDIFLDHAGFSTYDSIYRARDVFEVERMVIVTQRYHEYRAQYIAKRLGVTAVGVASDQATYSGQEARDLREVGSRVKAFGMCIVKPKPKYLGEPIPIGGSGVSTQLSY